MTWFDILFIKYVNCNINEYWCIKINQIDNKYLIFKYLDIIIIISLY